MKQTTKLYLIIACLVAVIFIREIKHAQRTAKTGQYYNELVACEQELDQLQDNYLETLEQGRQEILEQF